MIYRRVILKRLHWNDAEDAPGAMQRESIMKWFSPPTAPRLPQSDNTAQVSADGALIALGQPLQSA